jgi:hypothetical protein
MTRRTSAIPITAWIVCTLAVLFCPSCRQEARPDPRRHVPDAPAARRAVEGSLEEWRRSPPIDLTTTTVRPVVFVDQQRQPGRRLRDFAVLGEAEMDGCRRFQVRLSLADPDESILTAYYVFGRDTIWVYRAEDFDMIMPMDKTMMEARAAEADMPTAGEKGGR